MLKTKVKASSITNLTDARYFAAWEVEWLGFNFDPMAEDYIQPQVMKAIKEWVDGVKIVGEFSMQPAEEIQEAIKLLELEAIQLSPFYTTEQVATLDVSVPIIQEIIISPEHSQEDILDTLESYHGLAQYFLLNFDKNGISWESIKNGNFLSSSFVSSISETFPFIISIDVQAEEIDNLLEKVQPAGLNLKGGEEEKVGFKSFDELDDIFEALEVLI
jgi:phosphoribosylanthranilate isomerase